LEFCRHRNFVAPPIYRGVLMSPMKFRSPADLSRGIDVSNILLG
jgi:hypothetical protein